MPIYPCIYTMQGACIIASFDVMPRARNKGYSQAWERAKHRALFYSKGIEDRSDVFSSSTKYAKSFIPAPGRAYQIGPGKPVIQYVYTCRHDTCLRQGRHASCYSKPYSMCIYKGHHIGLILA